MISAKRRGQRQKNRCFHSVIHPNKNTDADLLSLCFCRSTFCFRENTEKAIFFFIGPDINFVISISYILFSRFIPFPIVFLSIFSLYFFRVYSLLSIHWSTFTVFFYVLFPFLVILYFPSFINANFYFLLEEGSRFLLHISHKRPIHLFAVVWQKTGY